MKRPTILIVDDEQLNIKLVKAMLVSEDCLLLEAAHGEEALEIVKEAGPDLILLDVKMPGIDGFEVCRRLKQNHRTRIIPVVMVTVLPEKKHRIKAIEAGADDFLTKPVDETELIVRVKSLLRIKSYHDALRRSEEKHRLILEANPDPVVFYDIEGKVNYLNSAFTGVFGWTLEEFISRTMDDFVPADVKSEAKMLNGKVLAGERVSGFETRRCNKKGAIVPVSISGAAFHDRNGLPLGIIMNLRDITEAKKIEAYLQRAHKMEAIGMLAGGVAHDLNNILSGLVSYPELLIMDLPEESPLKNSVLTIQKAGEKAAAIVQDLLTLTRRGVAVVEVVNLKDCITEYLKSPEFEKLISYHPDVQVRTDIETNLSNISGSPVHLSKAIMNLVSNAAEAMNHGGKILISAKNQYIDTPIKGYDHVAEGDYVVLSISDTGVGISPEDRERIFEPFYTKKVMGRSGTGLGMAVVWGTIKDHNAYIDLQSTEGKGTTCTLYFPVTRTKATRDDSILSIEDYMGKGESILIVDDVAEQREIASRMLKKLGYSVFSVQSGEEAVDYMNHNSAELVVLDMIMDPGIDGLETYKRIVELHPGQAAIIASGYSETEHVKEAKKLGAGAYLQKPYHLEGIGLVVKNELDKKQCAYA